MPCELSTRSPGLEAAPNDPTPAEIFAKCAEIRSRWSEHELRRRSAWCVTEPVTAPEVEIYEDDRFELR